MRRGLDLPRGKGNHRRQKRAANIASQPIAAGAAQAERHVRPEKQIEPSNSLWQYTAMNTEWSNCPAVEREPGKVSGAWVFHGTRVPVRALFENIEGGASVDDFLEWFPGVTRQQVETVLEYVSADLLVASPA